MNLMFLNVLVVVNVDLRNAFFFLFFQLLLSLDQLPCMYCLFT